jgi:hypothetical protein
LREVRATAVPLPGTVWHIVGEILHASRFAATGNYCKLRSATIDAFCQVACHSGAALPLRIRKEIARSPDTPLGPLSTWVTFLWRVFPPSEEDLTPDEGGTPPVRIAIANPFLASIDAIELCSLDTDQPRFSPAEMPGLTALAEAKSRMTVEQASEEAMKLAHKLRARFFALSERQQAEMIGCHWQTWKRTPFFSQLKKRRLDSKQKMPSSPKTESLTSGREAVIGEGDRDEVLEKLMAEQEADKEPSPLENDPPYRPRKVHFRKRL